MGFCPCEPSGTSAGLCRGRKREGGGGNGLSAQARAKSGELLSTPHPLSDPYNMVIVRRWMTRPLRRCGPLLGLRLWTRFLSSAWKKSNPCKYGASVDAKGRNVRGVSNLTFDLTNKEHESSRIGRQNGPPAADWVFFVCDADWQMTWEDDVRVRITVRAVPRWSTCVWLDREDRKDWSSGLISRSVWHLDDLVDAKVCRKSKAVFSVRLSLCKFSPT